MSDAQIVWLCGNAGYEHNQVEWILSSEREALGWLQDERIRRIADEERQRDYIVTMGWDWVGSAPTAITGSTGEGWSFEFGVGDFCYVRKRTVFDVLPPDPKPPATPLPTPTPQTK